MVDEKISKLSNWKRKFFELHRYSHVHQQSKIAHVSATVSDEFGWQLQSREK